jgi:hypothetical protein
MVMEKTAIQTHAANGAGRFDPRLKRRMTGITAISPSVCCLNPSRHPLSALQYMLADPGRVCIEFDRLRLVF